MLMKFLWAVNLGMVRIYTVGDKISGGVDKIIRELMKIVNPIATVAIVGCGLYLLLGSDPMYIKKATSGGLSILVGLIIINLAETIVTWAAGLAG